MDSRKLTEPFPVHVVKTRDSGKGGIFAYIDARHVMDRLDEVLGPANWEDSYRETPSGRVLCKLSLNIDGQWISKEDGAGETSFEGEKGAISDALKRAAVKWGIGRYLYALPFAKTDEQVRINLEEQTNAWIMEEEGPVLAKLIDAADPIEGTGVDAFGEAWLELGEGLQRAFGKYISIHYPGAVSSTKQKMRDIIAVYRERLNT